MNALAVLLFVVAAVSAKDDCTDEHELCSFWATQFDQCNQNAVWMKPNCPASCGKCNGEKKVVIKKCNDEDELCAKFAANGECEKSPDYMFWKCQKACKFCAGEGPQPYPKALQARGGKQEGHRGGKSHSHEKKENGGEMKHHEAGGNVECTDHHDLCPFWKSLGECTANPNFMLRSCKASCNDCNPKKIKIEKCASEDANCDAWKAAGECDKPGPFYMFWKCEKTCGFCSHDGEVVDYPKGLLNAAQPANGQLVQPTAGGASSTTAPQTVPTQPAATLPPVVANVVQSQAATVTVPAVVQTQPPTPGSSQPPVVFVTQPAPVATQPAPVATQPAPVATQPAPVATQPAPVATQPPAPATTLPPAPVVTTQSVPAPIATQPAAVVTQQAPAVQTTQSQTAAPTTQSSPTTAAPTTAAPTTQSQPTTAAAVVTTTAAAAPTTQSVPIVVATAPASTQAPAVTAGSSQAPAVVATAGSSQAPAVQATTVQFSTDIKQSAAAPAGGCTDKHRLCSFWKSIGECSANPNWMVPNCAASCKSCTPSRVFIDTCADTDPNCAAFGAQGECSKSFVFYMFWKCPKTCNFCTADKTEIDYPAALLNAPAGTTAPKIVHHL